MRATTAAVLWLTLITVALLVWFQPDPDPECIAGLDRLTVQTVAECVTIPNHRSTP